MNACMVLIYYYIIILLIPKTCRTPLSLEGKFPKLQIPLRNVESRKLGSPFSAKTLDISDVPMGFGRK